MAERKGSAFTWPIRNRRIAAVALHDTFMAAASFELALAFRRILQDAAPRFFEMWEGTLIVALCSTMVFAAMGLYRGIWHYASFRDLTQIAKATTLALLVALPALFFVTRLQDVPRTLFLIQWPIMVGLLFGPRLLYRAWKDGGIRSALSRGMDERIPVLLIGASSGAEIFIREMERNREHGYRAVGILDDSAARLGRTIHNIPVLGTPEQLPQIMEKLGRAGNRPRRLVFTERLPGSKVRALMDLAEKYGVAFGSLPRLTDFSRQDGRRASIRSIDVEDVLGRPQRVLDREGVAALVKGRRVLVTGAGGTIGGELVRQIAALAPASLVLLDNGEHNLYQIDLELSELAASGGPAPIREAVLGDVRDAARIEDVFRRLSPEIIFHAAAFKHVPLVEANPNEAALTNVEGTRIVAEACLRHKAAMMVMISTDKAVNPTNVMGATKRIAEMVTQSLNLEAGDTRFVTVRFGNVLGSTGSVVPLFQRQLARGGPLTVTHPDVTRYFMTVREAVELVLQAASHVDPQQLGQGRIYVLDMGDPVRIQDLARQMIRLAGLKPDRDIKIDYVGLRPGEKLYEELLHDAEQLMQSGMDGIMLAEPRSVGRAELYPILDRLIDSAARRDRAKTLDIIQSLVPEFNHKPEGQA